MLRFVWVALLTLCAAYSFFFFNDTATTEIYTLSLHDALPISAPAQRSSRRSASLADSALSGNRESELERGAATQRGIHSDRSAEHLLRDLTDDRQTGARARSELLGGEARLKDPLEMLGRDPHALVLDCQAQRLAHLFECDQDGRVPLPGRRHRIADQVGEHLIQGVRVTMEQHAAHRDDPMERDAALARERPFQRHARPDDLPRVEPLRSSQPSPGPVLHRA